MMRKKVNKPAVVFGTKLKPEEVPLLVAVVVAALANSDFVG